MTQLHIDLDRLKEINDSMGYEMGNRILAEASCRPKKSVRGIDDQLSVQRVCQHHLGSLSDALNLNDEIENLTASINVSFYPADTEILQRNADQAMYAAKTQGRNRYPFFTSEFQEGTRPKRQMITDLRKVLERAEVETLLADRK